MEITKIYDCLPEAVKEKAIALAQQVKASSNNSKSLAKSIYDLVNDVTFKGMKSEKNKKKPMGIAEFADKYFQGYLTGAMAHKYYTAYSVLAMHDAIMWDTLPIGKLCIASQIRSKRMRDAGVSTFKFYEYYLKAVRSVTVGQWKEYNAKRTEIKAGIDSTESPEIKSILENQMKQIVPPVYPEDYLKVILENKNHDERKAEITETALADFAIMSDKDFSGWVKAYKESIFPPERKDSDSHNNGTGENSSESTEPEPTPETPETWASEALQNLEKYVKAVPGCSPKIKSALSELRKLCGTEPGN